VSSSPSLTHFSTERSSEAGVAGAAAALTSLFPNSCRSTMTILALPEEALEQVVHHLQAPDILSFLSAHRATNRLGLVSSFWQSLEAIQYPSFQPRLEEEDEEDTPRNTKAATVYWKEAKNAYLLKAHCNILPSVQWYPVNEGIHTPDSREGHMGCRLGNYVVMTGGFTQDRFVYVKDIRNGNDWQRVRPDEDGPMPVWAYGASLTAIDDSRAVRFGGFQAGGYSAETCQVAVLHLVEEATGGNSVLRARWEIVNCKHPNGNVIQASDRHWSRLASRAYHAAVLLQNRYLFVVGGMQSHQSILNPIILDTANWTWHSEHLTNGTAPSPRHGCSIVSDVKRGRLVLFGGGSGSDLLRSGEDYPEVWELDLNISVGQVRDDDLLRTLPWTWSRLHGDEGQEEAEHAENNMNENEESDPNLLSPTEKLNLGRCHGSYRLGNETCLLAFGSGRPSCNSLLGYRLDRREFFRPAIEGPLPQDRFTFASVYVEEHGYLIVHGGYSSQTSDTVSNTCVLDLAPGMKRPFRLWPVNQRARSYPAVTNEQVEARAARPREEMQHEHIVGLLMHVSAAERPDTAAMLLAELAARREIDVRLAMFLRLIASGRVRLAADGSLQSDDDDTEDEDFDLEE